MTSKQVKYGLGNTASGSLNKKQFENKLKQIDLQDFDVQMISPQFLQSKTLKRPLKQYGLQFVNTNPNFYKAQNDKTQKNTLYINQSKESLKSMEELDTNLIKTQKMNYTFISLDHNKIKPAYQKVSAVQNCIAASTCMPKSDKNTIFSAMVRKNENQKPHISFCIPSPSQVLKSNQPSSQAQTKSMGSSQNRLKQLFNKSKRSSFSIQKKQAAQIQEQIQQSIGQYGDDQFQKYDQSAKIKQSIKQDFGASSGIRESIAKSSFARLSRNQIAEDIQQSIRVSNSSKEMIQQFIHSYKSSNNAIKQEIPQSLSGSRKSQESVYEEIFQEYDQSLNKSRGAFRKSVNLSKQHDPLSKSFRKKNTVIHSIKLAQQINIQASFDGSLDSKRITDGDKYSQQLLNEKKDISKKKTKLVDLLKKTGENFKAPQKNKNLLYEFKIQLNKLLTGSNFESKLHRLTSFINYGPTSTSSSISSLQDKILQNILSQISKMKKPNLQHDQIQSLRKQYDTKLSTMLKDQQINLRVEMDKKLQQKDMQLKKMIAELEQKFQGKQFTNKINLQRPTNQHHSHYQIDSDYSIDSDNISWKADLWEVLPQYEKKRLYQRQTKQVTNFLTDIMINQLKEQSLNRSLDISFEFPDDLNNSQDSKQSNLPSIANAKQLRQQDSFMPKAAFNRKQFEQNIVVAPAMAISPKKESAFPDFARPKQSPSLNDFSQLISSGCSNSSVNQYSKFQGEVAIQITKKDIVLAQKIMVILSKYKSSYVRKKNDIIRKILKILKPKDSSKLPKDHLLSTIQQIILLNKQDINTDDLVYVRAFEEELIWTMVAIITKYQNRKTPQIQEQIRKQYQRLIVLAQVKTSDHSHQMVTLDLYNDHKQYNNLKNDTQRMQDKSCPIETPIRQQAIEMLEKRQQKKIKDTLVAQIMNSLMAQFAKDFPKRKK